MRLIIEARLGDGDSDTINEVSCLRRTQPIYAAGVEDR